MIRILMLTTLLTGLMVSGCGRVEFQYTIKKPADVNMKGFKKIAIDGFKGNNNGHAQVATDYLTSKLIHSKHFDAVLDRKHLDQLIAENKLKMSGLVDDSSILLMGRFVGATALITGSIGVDSYQETKSIQPDIKTIVDIRTTLVTNTNLVSYSQNTEAVQMSFTLKVATNTITNKTYQTNMVHKRKGNYTLTISFQIIDMKTAKLITAQTLTAVRTPVESAVDREPDAINPEMLFVNCADELCGRFTRMLIPSYEAGVVTFLIDGNLPDSEAAVNAIKAGNYDFGIGLLQRQLQNPRLDSVLLSKAYYDIGLAQLISERYDAARQSINQARSLQPSEDLYTEALRAVDYSQQNAQLLKEQE